MGWGRLVSSGSARSSGEATIQTTRRTTYWVGILRAFRIYIDGHYVGTVDDGATAEFPVEPGLHEVFLRVDWCGSPRVQVRCAPGGVARLICRGRANPFVALYTGFFDWDQFIRLFAVPDPSERARAAAATPRA
jgi:hypothetical protein